MWTGNELFSWHRRKVAQAEALESSQGSLGCDSRWTELPLEIFIHHFSVLREDLKYSSLAPHLPRQFCEAKDDLELLLQLPSYRCTSTHLGSNAVVEMDLMLSRPSANQAPPPQPAITHHFVGMDEALFISSLTGWNTFWVYMATTKGFPF